MNAENSAIASKGWPPTIADFQAVEAERDRFAAALEQVSTVGHPEWCSYSCFGGEEMKTCDCWVKPVREALGR